MKFQAAAVALTSASSLIAATAVPPQESVQISNTTKLSGPLDVLSAALSELYAAHPKTTLATVTKKSAGGHAAPAPAPTTANKEEYGAKETESYGPEPIPLGNGKCFLPCPPPARCIVESIIDCDSTTAAPAGYDAPTSQPSVSLETIFVTTTITPMFATATWLPTDCPPDATIGPGHALCLGRPTQVFVETFTKDVVTHSLEYPSVTATAIATATSAAGHVEEH